MSKCTLLPKMEINYHPHYSRLPKANLAIAPPICFVRERSKITWFFRKVTTVFPSVIFLPSNGHGSLHIYDLSSSVACLSLFYVQNYMSIRSFIINIFNVPADHIGNLPHVLSKLSEAGHATC